MLSSTVRKSPNPFLFLGLIVASGGTFYLIVRHRETAHPASKQPLQHAHPLVPPRQHDRQDTD
ncbi:hypothetical protein HD554DRAFT_2025314 [Boletus coccyginus]|nr:hypothetical protein HD554DRAFT_2025314 [Boletus coccyginus]